MIRILPLLLLAACAGGRRYDNSDAVLAAGYAARDVCSCVFVMEQDDAFCEAWVKAKPDVGRYEVDREAGTVRSSVVGLWHARAHYVDERTGCVLE